tara:strand:- start:331 stop:822 length:492 start_codon:yes stop_codon:yes gene_type:complete
MAKDKKFLKLFEAYESRFNQEGFLVGDVFKFNDDFKSHDEYKGLGANVKAAIDSMIDSGLHVRVSQVGANSDHVVVGSDQGGGRVINKITIPITLGEPVDFGINLPPIAEVQKRDDEVKVKPEEVPELPALSNSKGAVKADEDEEEVVAEKVETRDTYTQQYL